MIGMCGRFTVRSQGSWDVFTVRNGVTEPASRGGKHFDLTAALKIRTQLRAYPGTLRFEANPEICGVLEKQTQ